MSSAQVKASNLGKPASIADKGSADLTAEISHVFDTVREPLVALSFELQVRLVNPAFYKHFRVRKEETEGRFIYDLGNGQWNIPRLRTLLEDILPKKNTFSDFEVAHNFEQIGHRTMLLNARRINRGRLILLAIEDITERRRAELELKRSNQELEQFAFIASHDLKEPLRNIAGHLMLLEERCNALDDKNIESIRFAVDGAKRMRALIDSLLDYSRAGRTERCELVDLNKVFEAVCVQLSVSINEGVCLVTKTELPNLKGDPAEFAQLFQNLISNGIKYRSKAPPEIRMSAKKQETEWLFAVQDNGMGIVPEDRDRIFEMFRRSRSIGEVPGTGIGLAICKKIVERRGGRIWVDSEPGNGSNFLFTLPV